MDETAFNYNPEANVTDGNCEAVAYGCMDDSALNYDADANTDTPEDCVYGCDGEYVTVSVTTGSWAYELSWELMTSLGDTLMSSAPNSYENATTYSEDICLGLGETFLMSTHDSYGDGWNGGFFSITSCGDVIDGGISQAMGYPAGAGEDYQFEIISCADVVPGCTDVNALNQDLDATHDDGSCEYAVPSLLTPESGSVFDVSTTDSIVFTWEPLYPANPGGYYVMFSTDSADLEGSLIMSGQNFALDDSLIWTDYDGLYNIFVDNNYGPGDEFNLFWFVSPDPSTEDGFGSYYAEPHAITITISAITGCMDPGAFNYNAEATVDDGSCELPCESGLTLRMYDSYGDGWNGNELVINAQSFTLDGINDDGSFAEVCVDADAASCVAMSWVMGSWTTETSWELFDASATLVAEGAAGSVPDAIGNCIEGCTDSNYAEYDENADIDDGSCATFLGTCSPVSMDMVDSWGDGWNGATYSIVDADGNEVASGGLTSGDSGSDALCLDDGCYTITVGGGFYDSEISWTLGDLASGGAPSSVNFDLNGDCEFAVLGCTDPAADNYNPDATEDDGSCFTTISGCTDPAADNFDPFANSDDGSCYYSCADGQAQVDILVTTDTYSGSENSFTLEGDNGFFVNVNLSYDAQLTTFTSTYCVDNGTNLEFVLTDSWGDGIFNGGYEIYVCQESLTGFVPMTDVSSMSEEFMAVCGDIFGCMDESALNYNADATADDGSCTYPCVMV